MPIHYARTPTRIDLAGGWTDVPRFAEVVPGAVLNYAVSLYSHARIADIEGDRLTLRSRDYAASTDVRVGRPARDDELHGPFSLVKAALRRRPLKQAADVLTHSEAPPGSGLGTSAAMGVALIGALDAATGTASGEADIAETAVALETEDLGLLSGKQDHYASTLGGVHYMTFQGEQVTHTRLSLSDWGLAQLRARVVLVYTGSSRLSSDLHEHVVGRFNARDAGLLATLEEIAAIAEGARDALAAADYTELGRCVAANWDCQKRLYPGITTDQIEALADVGRNNGALGMKACGAGGGGCLVFVARDGHEAPLAAALADAGAQVLRYDIAQRGLLTWSRPHAD
jgi:D-glycero-alpha-D-manno-heptose-7-phosphate kinase